MVTFLHTALLYRGDNEYIEGTVPFVRAGLRSGEPVAMAVPGSRHALLKAALGSDSAAVHWIDLAVAGRNPGWIIPGVLRRFTDQHAAGSAPARLVVESIWSGRTALEYPACAQHEALVNLAYAGSPASVLCPYDTERLSADALGDAEATHPELTGPQGRRRSACYAPEQVVAAHNRPLPRPFDTEEYTFHAETLSKVRVFACDHGDRYGLTGEQVGALEVAVNELAVNSVLHAGGGGTLRMWTDGSRVVAEVQDRGRLTDPLAGRTPAALGTNGGRGMLIVNDLADLVRTYTTAGATTIRLYLNLR